MNAEQTPKPPSGQPPPHRLRRTAENADAYVLVVVGLLMLVFIPSASKLWNWHFDREAFNKAWRFADQEGRPMIYPDTAWWWEDLGFTAFAVAIVVMGVVLRLARSPIALGALMAAMGLIAVFNVWVLLRNRPLIGLSLLPALCVAFGAYQTIRLAAAVRSARGGEGSSPAERGV